MDDKSFDELKLKMTILPQQATWPEPRFTHWERLHAVPDELRQRVGEVNAKLAEIAADNKLSPEGKRQAAADVVERAIAAHKKSDTLERARAAVARQQKTWSERFGIDEIIKPADDIGLATIHAQCRERISTMRPEDRLAFLQKNAADPVVAAAVLSAPTFLSGLSDSEVAMVRRSVEKRVVPADVAEAMAATERALAEAERGWDHAAKLIGGLAAPVKAKAAA